MIINVKLRLRKNRMIINGVVTFLGSESRGRIKIIVKRDDTKAGTDYLIWSNLYPDRI